MDAWIDEEFGNLFLGDNGGLEDDWPFRDEELMAWLPDGESNLPDFDLALQGLQEQELGKDDTANKADEAETLMQPRRPPPPLSPMSQAANPSYARRADRVLGAFVWFDDRKTLRINGEPLYASLVLSAYKTHVEAARKAKTNLPNKLIQAMQRVLMQPKDDGIRSLLSVVTQEASLERLVAYLDISHIVLIDAASPHQSAIALGFEDWSEARLAPRLVRHPLQTNESLATDASKDSVALYAIPRSVYLDPVPLSRQSIVAPVGPARMTDHADFGLVVRVDRVVVDMMRHAIERERVGIEAKSSLLMKRAAGLWKNERQGANGIFDLVSDDHMDTRKGLMYVSARMAALCALGCDKPFVDLSLADAKMSAHTTRLLKTCAYMMLEGKGDASPSIPVVMAHSMYDAPQRLRGSAYFMLSAFSLLSEGPASSSAQVTAAALCGALHYRPTFIEWIRYRNQWRQLFWGRRGTIWKLVNPGKKRIEALLQAARLGQLDPQSGLPTSAYDRPPYTNIRLPLRLESTALMDGAFSTTFRAIEPLNAQHRTALAKLWLVFGTQMDALWNVVRGSYSLSLYGASLKNNLRRQDAETQPDALAYYNRVMTRVESDAMWAGQKPSVLPAASSSVSPRFYNLPRAVTRSKTLRVRGAATLPWHRSTTLRTSASDMRMSPPWPESALSVPRLSKTIGTTATALQMERLSTIFKAWWTLRDPTLASANRGIPTSRQARRVLFGDNENRVPDPLSPEDLCSLASFFLLVGKVDRAVQSNVVRATAKGWVGKGPWRYVQANTVMEAMPLLAVAVHEAPSPLSQRARALLERVLDMHFGAKASPMSRSQLGTRVEASGAIVHAFLSAVWIGDLAVTADGPSKPLARTQNAWRFQLERGQTHLMADVVAWAAQSVSERRLTRGFRKSAIRAVQLRINPRMTAVDGLVFRRLVVSNALSLVPYLDAERARQSLADAPLGSYSLANGLKRLYLALLVGGNHRLPNAAHWMQSDAFAAVAAHHGARDVMGAALSETRYRLGLLDAILAAIAKWNLAYHTPPIGEARNPKSFVYTGRFFRTTLATQRLESQLESHAFFDLSQSDGAHRQRFQRAMRKDVERGTHLAHLYMLERLALLPNPYDKWAATAIERQVGQGFELLDKRARLSEARI